MQHVLIKYAHVLICISAGEGSQHFSAFIIYQVSIWLCDKGLHTLYTSSRDCLFYSSLKVNALCLCKHYTKNLYLRYLKFKGIAYMPGSTCTILYLVVCA